MTRKSTFSYQRSNHAQKSRENIQKQSERSGDSKPEPTLSLIYRSVLRSGLSYDSYVSLLIQSALSRLKIWTQADLDRLLLLSERWGLDPLNNEIYAIEVTPENGKKSRILFVVGVDGWYKIINSHPQFDGMRFVESSPGEDELPLYIECTIFRKDRRVATSIREYMYEAQTNQGAWLTHPRRMLRHKAMVQCARACFGLAGMYEPDEARRVSSAPQLEKKKEPQHASPGSSSGPSKSTPRPLGKSALKGWIQQASNSGLQGSQ